MICKQDDAGEFDKAQLVTKYMVDVLNTTCETNRPIAASMDHRL